jgi:hypothetical protein
MGGSSDVQHTGSGKISATIGLFFYRWFALIALLYGLFGFLFYFFLLVTNHDGATTGLPFRELTKDTLWIWLLIFAILHLVVFSGGLLLLLYNKVLGYIFFITAMPSILLANVLINNEINITSWGIVLVLGFFIWKGCKHAD